MRFITNFAWLPLLIPFSLKAQHPDWTGGRADGCTTITVGKSATADGSVITSHTDDSHRTRSWMDIREAGDHPEGATVIMYRRMACDSFLMPAYSHIPIGEIPQVSHTYQFLNTAYPCLNEHQLAIGESTFGGRDTLQSNNGLIDCQRLCKLILERCKTAREAIRMADDLTTRYGWIDFGECLTIADKKEVWHFEILGPGKGKKGAVWAAQRVPDDHVAVNANASTIRELDLTDPNHFMTSENIFDLAAGMGWWEKGEVFRFCDVYAPDSRKSFASTRREWRVFDLLAPSLNLDPDAMDYPFSVKPDKKVSLGDLKKVFSDYYEDTPFDMTRDMLVTDENGNLVKSPLANPHLPYDMNKLLGIEGGWGWRGERTIARWYTMYATIIQCREWLPDEIGGVAWLALDNVSSSIYIPVYGSVSRLPDSYRTPGRSGGFNRESAWWAFNRLGTLTAQRWGEMRYDVNNVWDPWQTELFNEQASVEKRALELYSRGGDEEWREYLTGYTVDWGNKVVRKAWELGDMLWTKYDEKF